MNHLLILWVVTVAFLSLTPALAQSSLTTLDGTTFTAVTVNRVENGQAIISHSGGIAAIDLSNLPKSFRSENGLLPGFDETRDAYRRAIQNWISGYLRLNSQYDGALQALEERLSSGGETDQVDAVKAERESFRSVISKEVSAFEELGKLQSSYRAFKDRWENENSDKLVTITDVYLKTLNEVVSRKTKEGDIDDAVAAKAEIERFINAAGDSDQIQTLLGAGPAIVRVQESIKDLSPDGNPDDKPSGVMAVMTAGQKTDLVLPIGVQGMEVVEMAGNWETWAALKSDGKLVSSPLEGDGIPEDHKPVVWFRVGAGMVTAFHPDGSHSVFGEAKNSDDVPPETLTQTVQFELDRGSGIALSKEGRIAVWGSMYQDETARKEIENQFEEVSFVDASENLAWVVTADGEIYFWRNGGEPELVGTHERISSFKGGRSAYLVLLEDGKLDGGAVGEGENPIIHVPENLREGKAIRVDGWGYALQFEGGAWLTWGGPAESSTLHTSAKVAGSLLDLEISAAPGRFVLMMLRES